MSGTPDEILLTVIIGTAILVLLIGVVIYFVFAYQKKQLLYLQEKQRIHNQYEREILRTQLEVQEQTHQQISRDIHDNVGQVLAVVRMYLKGLQDSADETAKPRIQETDQLVGGAITDLRNLAHSLSSEQLKKNGLAAVLRAEVDRIANTGQMEIGMNSTSEDAAADHEIKLILFRICQELLANMIRHSQATKATVTLNETRTAIDIIISDNGVGFVPGEKDGNGLFNIYRRAELIGAKVNLISGPGKGTEATVTWNQNPR